jgi:chemotaxis protein histidine kinase CheA
MTDVDVDSMLSNFDALLAKYQTTASPDLKTTEAVDKITWPADRKADKPMEVVYQQDRPASPPPVFDVPSSPRADTPPQLRPPPRQPPAPTPARGDSEVADAYDEDFDEDFEEDIGGDDDAPAAPAKPATPELPKPAARAGRRAGAPAALSPGVTPPGEIGFGGKRLVEEFGGKRVPKPVGNGWAERSGLQEQERQRQERMLADARSEAVRLERLEAQMREEEEERRREDEEVERRIAAARRRKEEAALRQRDADADREAMAGGSFLTSVDLPDISSARPVVNPPLAKGPKQRSKPPPARASREPPAKPPVPVAESSVVDEIVKERKRMADLARENAQLGAELSKVQREVERVRKEAQVLQGKAGPPRSAGAMRPASKQGGRGGRRPPSTADAERELRLAQNARRQLEYYAKEHEQLRRQVTAPCCHSRRCWPFRSPGTSNARRTHRHATTRVSSTHTHIKPTPSQARRFSPNICTSPAAHERPTTPHHASVR